MYTFAQSQWKVNTPNQQCLDSLMIEVYKYFDILSPQIINYTYNL